MELMTNHQHQFLSPTKVFKIITNEIVCGLNYFSRLAVLLKKCTYWPLLTYAAVWLSVAPHED